TSSEYETRSIPVGAEVRRQRSEIRDQRSEIRSQNSESDDGHQDSIRPLCATPKRMERPVRENHDPNAQTSEVSETSEVSWICRFFLGQRLRHGTQSIS